MARGDLMPWGGRARLILAYPLDIAGVNDVGGASTRRAVRTVGAPRLMRAPAPPILAATRGWAAASA
jgi:hypothetical protein